MEKKLRDRLVGIISVLAGVATITTAAVTLFGGDGAAPGTSTETREQGAAGHGETAGFPSFSATITTDGEAQQFIDFLSDHHDEIVELDVLSEMNADYFRGDATTTYFFALGHEVGFIGGYRPELQHGTYLTRGYFLVVPGGLYQGILTTGLKHIPREEVLLRQ